MALVWIKEIKEETKIGVWKINESFEELQMMIPLTQQDIQFLKGVPNEKRRRQWLASRILLRKLLRLNISDYLHTYIDEHEKPFLKHHPYHISISHSFDYAAVILSQDHLVGCDIEKIDSKILRIEERFLGKGELKFIHEENLNNHKDPLHRILSLYILWTAKEAIYKLYGKKMISFKNNILVHPFSIEKPEIFFPNRISNLEPFPLIPPLSGRVKATLNLENFLKHLSVHYQILEGFMLSWVWDD